jgi:serine/threonine protein kinase
MCTYTTLITTNFAHLNLQLQPFEHTGGYPPFHDENQTRLFRKIRAGSFKFHPEYWGSVSAEAKDLISRLLTVDVKRVSAKL